MPVSDFAALETVEYDALVDLYRAAPAAIRRAFDVDVHEIAGATCVACRKLEPALVFRRAVGVGVAHAAAEAGLDRIIEFMRSRGERYTVPVAPASRPATLGRWLEARGFTPGYAWMKFSRPCQDPPAVDTDLVVRTAGLADAAAFGQVVTGAFGLPDAIAPWIGALTGRSGWTCLLAFDGDLPVAGGAVFVRGQYAWLGFGGTLATHRRHGAQNALIARRLEEAAARGATTAVTETGERLPDLPGNSYRNILRAGFEERYLRQNYLSPVD